MPVFGPSGSIDALAPSVVRAHREPDGHAVVRGRRALETEALIEPRYIGTGQRGLFLLSILAE